MCVIDIFTDGIFGNGVRQTDVAKWGYQIQMNDHDRRRRNLRLGLLLFAIFIILFIVATIIALEKN